MKEAMDGGEPFESELEPPPGDVGVTVGANDVSRI
jgi:hypothetical protein